MVNLTLFTIALYHLETVCFVYQVRLILNIIIANNQVQVIKEWNNQRLSIKSLLGDFLAYLLDEENKKPHSSYYKYNKLLSRV